MLLGQGHVLRTSMVLLSLLCACGGRAEGTRGGTGTTAGTGVGTGGGGSRPNSGFAGAGTASGPSNAGGGGAGPTGSADAGASAELPSNRDCAETEPCGGTLVGTWDVVDSCLVVDGLADVGVWGFGCGLVPVSGALNVTGIFSVSSSDSLVDTTHTTGVVRFDFAESCLSISAVPVACETLGRLFVEGAGFKTAQCRQVGPLCRCDALVDQVGSMGIVSPIPTDEATVFVDSPTHFSTSGDGAYSFCSSANRLMVTPSLSSQSIRLGALEPTGAITLERR